MLFPNIRRGVLAVLVLWVVVIGLYHYAPYCAEVAEVLAWVLTVLAAIGTSWTVFIIAVKWDS